MDELTAEMVLDCNEGEQLSHWVAVECKGWELRHSDGLRKGESLDWWKGSNGLNKSDWQPHKATEKGLAQCWRLCEEHNIKINHRDQRLIYGDKGCNGVLDIKTQADRRTQYGVLKAALLMVIAQREATADTDLVTS